MRNRNGENSSAKQKSIHLSPHKNERRAIIRPSAGIMDGHGGESKHEMMIID
jgi:hypothetical protein